MSAVAPSELARLWIEEQLPTERAIGQMLQQLVAMQTMLERQALVIAELRTQVTALSKPDVNAPTKLQRKPKR